MKGSVVTALPKKDTLASQVTRYLLDRIAREGLRPGDPAPSEVQVCRELNVSRGIVREAYRSLATLGVLAIESGKLPRVQEANPSVLTQFIACAMRTSHVTAHQVLQLRRAVEIEAARMAATNGTDAQFRELQHCIADMREAGTDHQRIIAADLALHTTLADATGNPLFTLMIRGLRGPLEDSIAEGLKSRRTRAEVLAIPDVHAVIVRHVCERDGEAAAAAMAHHFDVSASAILEAGGAVTPRRAREAKGRNT